MAGVAVLLLVTNLVPGINIVSALGAMVCMGLIFPLGKKNLAKGVKVEVLDSSVSVDLALILEYGQSIPVVCTKVQEKVKAAIENMTGFSVLDVNIKIAGITAEPVK